MPPGSAPRSMPVSMSSVLSTRPRPNSVRGSARLRRPKACRPRSGGGPPSSGNKANVTTSLETLFLQRRIERLLAPWRRDDGPGVSLGLVLGREIAVHTSAGMASIEHRVPLGPHTTFRIASVSKQFTCAAVLLLAADGRLSITDDVRDLIPTLPDLGHH